VKRNAIAIVRLAAILLSLQPPVLSLEDREGQPPAR